MRFVNRITEFKKIQNRYGRIVLYNLVPLSPYGSNSKSILYCRQFYSGSSLFRTRKVIHKLLDYTFCVRNKLGKIVVMKVFKFIREGSNVEQTSFILMKWIFYLLYW